MTEQERKANQDLHALDEAHRLGRITREDYRARRRQVLGALCDSNGVTARNAIAPPPAGAKRQAADTTAPGEALNMLFPARASQTRKYLIALAVGAVVCALLLYALLHGK
jgi:hypothetical protein